MVSFLIALQIDSEDRIKNLKISTDNLRYNYPDCEIIVVELDKISKVENTGFTHIFKEYTDFFSKTMAFNIAASLAKNDIICLYDCDIILEKTTMDGCIKHLSEVDIMYPYNGYFYDVPEYLHSRVDDEKTVSFVNIDECRFMSDRSVGGCVFFKKSVFLKGGGANENIKIGYEDNEIYERFKTLGYSIGRMNVPIFHLEHTRKETSFDYNPHKEEFQKEFHRICNMTKTELLQEVSTWRK